MCLALLCDIANTCLEDIYCIQSTWLGPGPVWHCKHYVLRTYIQMWLGPGAVWHCQHYVLRTNIQSTWLGPGAVWHCQHYVLRTDCAAVIMLTVIFSVIVSYLCRNIRLIIIAAENSPPQSSPPSFLQSILRTQRIDKDNEQVWTLPYVSEHLLEVPLYFRYCCSFKRSDGSESIPSLFK